MKNRNKNEVLEFIYATTGPIGPWVFAGFGSEIQKRLADNPGSYDILLEEWLNESDCIALARVLEEILLTPVLDEDFEKLKSKFPKDWEFVVVSLIFGVCERHETQYQELHANLAGVEAAKSIPAELDVWWNGHA